ncbi:hypothetical protein AAY473_034158 [Plecturocebus cupreus]
MDCSDFPERQTSSKRRLSPVYSAPRAAEPRRRQKSRASRKGHAGDPWGSSTGNVLVRGQQKFIGWNAVVRSWLIAASTSWTQAILLPWPPKYLGLQAHAMRQGFTMLPRLVLNSWTQVIHATQPPKRGSLTLLLKLKCSSAILVTAISASWVQAILLPQPPK